MRSLLTRLLNYVSMYRLVSIALTLLWANALILTLTGTLTYSPIAFVASSLVLVATTYCASLLFGTLFGVRVHSESSFITALILFFLFTPTLEPAGLLALGLTGIIAAASKFIFALRGRHLFNPVAIAAFIIGLTGLGFASWWVATPPLLPLTALLSFLILYKTRRLLMASIFIILGAVLIISQMMSYGDGLIESIGLLASWPLIFFAGFMLSEPLTLPKKRWEMLGEAVIVALLFAIPLHIGEFATNPVVALLIGNLFAAVISRRRSITLTLSDIKSLTPSSREFSFSTTKNINYEAGQYLELTLPHKAKDMRGERRVFSLTSSPDETELRFAAKFYDRSSTFKQTLMSLPIGARITATGINGDFLLPKNPATPLLFIAGGIGITPFISHLLELKKTNQTRNIILLYAVQTTAEIAYADLLSTSGVTVYIVAPKNDTDTEIAELHYTHTPRITKHLLQEIVPDITMRHVYVSGPPALVTNAKRLARQLHARKITTDYFIGY